MNNLSYLKISELKKFFEERSFQRIFLLTGKKSFNFSGAKKILKKILQNKNKIVKIYFKTNAYPEIEELKKIIQEIKNFSPDLILAIGGGSVIDYAKLANNLYDCEELKKRIVESSYKIDKSYCELVVIPTTAGSGAEVTENAVIYINKTKYSVENNKIKPKFFFLIPELILKSPHFIKSSAGFDAIAQSIESLISLKSNNLSVNFSIKSLQISLKNYLNYLKKPNLTNSMSMSVAANLSGKAISISKTTAPHALSYPFTALYNISHGHAVSLTLNNFLKFNYLNIKNSNSLFNLKKRYQIIFNLTKTKNINELDEYITQLKKQANLEQDFSKLGIDIAKSYTRIISRVNLIRLKNNPIKINKNDLKKILLS